MSENSNSIGLNELVDYQKKTYSPMMDGIMRFLWKCGGADPQILRYAPYSDHIKNAGIGGVVLATTVMAMLAMGFAMHTIFAEPDPLGTIDPITGDKALKGKWYITIPMSIVWGLIIFNLDRFIVSTVKGDGTEKITLGEWGAMLPRLFMAVLIGLTISAPLETYIFKREIMREWDEARVQMARNQRYELDKEFTNDGTSMQLTKRVTADSLVLSKAKFKKDSITDALIKTGCTLDPCPRHQHIINFKREITNEYSQALAAYSKDTSDLSNFLKTRRESLQKKSEEIKSLKPGFLDQIMMLERLSGEGKTIKERDEKGDVVKDEKGEEKSEKVYDSAFWPIWLVRLLFMIVEIAPVIFKFMIWKSSYDYMQDNVSQILEAKQGISLEIITDENNKMHKVKENYNARRIVEVSKRQNELEKENAIHAITLYAEKEREEIEKNPEKFVKPADESGSKA